MGLLSRLAIIFKSYIASTNERLDRIAAEEEQKLSKTTKDALKELDAVDVSTQPKASIPSAPVASTRIPDPLAADYKLLGLPRDADLEMVEKAWRQLALRADPKRFAPGSEEEKRAAEILRSINKAYARIRESLNPTEGRFGRLEL